MSAGRESLFSSLRWRLHLRWWRLIGRHISGWRDRRWERSHSFPITTGCGPFSHPESLWHECEGHEWERIEWPYGRAAKRGYARDRITRCRKCGAPRCDSYHPQEAFFLGLEGRWTDLNDAEKQAVRCTFERHHREAHDYLAGTRIEVGA